MKWHKSGCVVVCGVSYYKSSQGSNPMFKLMLRYNNEGDFIDTVYPPTDYATAVNRLNHYRKIWGQTHSYILVSTGASK